MEEEKKGRLASQLLRRGDGADSSKPLDKSIVADDIRRAVRRLARQESTSSSPAQEQSTSADITYRRDLPRENKPAEFYHPVPTGMVQLEQTVNGREESNPDMGSLYTVTTRAN